jgi:hypothetical protein
MDSLLAILPELNYWVIACAVLAFLNIYQFAIAHKLTGTVLDLRAHGHAPEGKVLVPVETVVATLPPPAAPAVAVIAAEPEPPGYNGNPGLFTIQVTGNTAQDVAAIMAQYYNQAALDRMRGPHRDGATTIESTTGETPK